MGSAGNTRTTEGRRRALLLGVTDTPDLRECPELAGRYTRLECAAQDVELLAATLKRSGYEVTQRAGEVTSNRLRGALNSFFTSCGPGDTAFVYLSCHGTSVDGHDYLIPSDAQPDGPRGLLTGTLIEADPSNILQGLRPEITTVVCVDACRAEDEDPARDKPQDRWVSDALDAVWLYGCGPGQYSYADPSGNSLFARALAEALQPNTPPNTFDDISEYTRKALRRLSAQLSFAPQIPDPFVPSRLQGRTGEIVLCEGSEDTLRWTRAIENSTLWEHTHGDPATHQRVRERLAELIRYVVDSCAGAGAHRDDPWHDPEYPERVVHRLGELIRGADLRPADLLSPAETACLLAGPFVHEGLVAVALQDLRTHQPLHLGAAATESGGSGDEHAQYVRSAAQDVCRAHSQVQRTADTLRARRLEEAAAAADHWLRHRFIADWDALWERDEDYPAVDAIVAKAVDAVVAAAEDAMAGPRSDAARRDVDDQVRQVLGHFTVNPGEEHNGPRVNVPGRPDQWNLRQPVRGNTWRGPSLARLLWSAATLATDPRRLSSVLVDHLGAHDPLRPQDVVTALAYEFDYTPTAGRTADTHGLDVRFSCPHPALHAAVEELVGHADATVASVHRDHSETGLPPLLNGLPDRITAENLIPRDQLYRQPLERFRLAEDEIRPLLMGTQLYGDRMLAVRELYQNALDACRYRSMRREYGARQSDCGSRAGWTPRISFIQGWDAEGRPYIECEDNGTGMTRAKLTSMFARAGKRYEQDPGFVQERRNWRRADVEDIGMNSRFGIGVFSYFMLAEEVVVWSRPVDLHGLPGSDGPLRADIQSGSGLLRVSDTADAPELGGTRVRLYLAAHGEHQPSLVEVLRSILWVSDYEVTAEERDGEDPGRVVRSAGWAAGVLAAKGSWTGQAVRAGRDAWLVQGEGKLLLDGVVVKKAPAVPGRVFNLRERHAPVPSVDRNEMLSYDEELVMRELLAGVPEGAVQWSEVPLTWLWELACEEPRLAVALLTALPGTTKAVLESGPDHRTLVLERLALAEAGCFPIDEALLKETYEGRSWAATSVNASTLVRDWQATRLCLSGPFGQEFRPVGYPDPAPLDALLFLDTPMSAPEGWHAVLRAAAMNRVSLRKSVRALRRYAVVGMHVPAVDEIRRLDEVRPDGTDVLVYSLYRNLGSGSGVRRPGTHAPLVVLSAHENLTYGALAARLEQLRALDPELPPPPPLTAEFAAERAGVEALLLVADAFDVFSGWDVRTEWRRLPVAAIDLLERADETLPVEEMIATVRHLAPLGLSFLPEPTEATVRHGQLKDSERLLLSDQRRPRLLRGELSMIQLFGISHRLQTPLGDIAKRINEIATATGVTAPEVPAEATSLVAPKWLSDIQRSSRRVPLGPWALVAAATSPQGRNSLQKGELREILPVLNACGLLRSDLDWDYESVIREVESHSSSMLHLRSFAFALDDQGITVPMALREGRTVGEQLDRLATMPRHLSVKAIAQLPAPSARNLRLEQGDHALLMTRLTGEAATFRGELTIRALLQRCRTADTPLGPSLAHVSRFAVLGAPLPPGDFAGPDALMLHDFMPDRFDLIAFGLGLLGSGALGPLELVLVAGRFGRTLGEVYERYAPFRCLGLDVTVAEPAPEEAGLVPDWQDVVVLTAQLTGRAPALIGDVTPAHLTLCAEETSLSESQVREQLARYARLFGLRLPEELPEQSGRKAPAT
ncbi:HD domain-containing protein [Streptomyces sp. NPDC002817]|uniref:HD domain-containing protein n=1 Tax=Streptomyces sp. NPDC088357 TaxID=3154655 RepID=UPI003428BB8F